MQFVYAKSQLMCLHFGIIKALRFYMREWSNHSRQYITHKFPLYPSICLLGTRFSLHIYE